MAVVDGSALTAQGAGVDTIAPHPTKLPPPVSDIDTSHSLSHTNGEHPQTVETLHLDEGDVNVRTKIRTLAIVSALYVVLFIAALDQTIIAYEPNKTLNRPYTCTYDDTEQPSLPSRLTYTLLLATHGLVAPTC